MESSIPFCSDNGEAFAFAREAGEGELSSTLASCSKRANVTWAVRPR